MHTVSRRLGPVVVAFALPLILSTCKGTSEPTLVATTIVITPATAVSLAAIGATQQLTAVVKDQNGNTLANASVAWTTSSAVVVTVSATGLATAAGNGSAHIIATSGSATTSVTVTVAQAAAQLLNVSGDLQTGTVGQTLAQPLVVLVNDANGHAIAGASVSFAAPAGSGSVGSATATTNASGQAQSIWTLGQTAGSQTASATVGALPALSFSATATAGAAASVAKQAGNGQTAVSGHAVATPPAVIVKDAFNNPKPGAAVTFAASAGNGSVTGPSQTTNASGVATVGSWTLGNVGTDTLSATVTGAGISDNPAVFTATSQAAANVAVYAGNNQMGLVGYPVNVRPEVRVTDALILAKFESIDGPGKILGQSGPCFIRIANGLTVLGVMVFDTADVATLIANGQLNTVILHEMNHVLGYGTLWNQSPNACMLLPSSPPGTIQDTYFGCPKARAAFDSMGGTSYTGGGSSPPAGNKVPVENCGTSPYVSPTCGAGTVNSHWREVVFDNELMTGFLNSGNNPLSVLSIAAQEDLGYTVNYAGADAYSHIFMAPPAVGGAPPLVLGDDIRHGPIYVVDATGTVVRVINR